MYMTRVTEYIYKVKQWCSENSSDLYVAAIILLVGLLAFGLGRLSTLWPQKEPITIENSQYPEQNTPAPTKNNASKIDVPKNSPVEGAYVASKAGSYYYLPSCSGVARIKEENKIWFQTKKEAESRGLKPAENCPGL